MREGDGVVSGRVAEPGRTARRGRPSRPPAATIEVSTVSLTLDDVGFFAVRTLPTPGPVHADVRARRLRVGDADRRPRRRPAAGRPRGHAGPDDRLDLRHRQPERRRPGRRRHRHRDRARTSSCRRRRRASATSGATCSTACRCRRPTRSRSPSRASSARPASSTSTRAPARPTSPASTPRWCRARRRSAASSRTAAGDAGRRAPTVVLNDGSETRELLSADDPLGRFEFSDVEPGAYTLTRQPARHVAGGAARQRRRRRRRRPRRPARGAGLAVRPGRCVLDDGERAVRPVRQGDRPAVRRRGLPGRGASQSPRRRRDADGSYTFAGLDAPDDFVVAVYSSPSAADPLDSELVQSQPSTAVERARRSEIRQAPEMRGVT